MFPLLATRFLRSLALQIRKPSASTFFTRCVMYRGVFFLSIRPRTIVPVLTCSDAIGAMVMICPGSIYPHIDGPPAITRAGWPVKRASNISSTVSQGSDIIGIPYRRKITALLRAQ